MKKSTFLFLTAALLCCQLFTGCGRKNQSPVSRSGFYFNTVITVTIYQPVEENVLDDCFALAADYESLFSNTIPESDVSRINAAGGKPVAVSEETIDLLDRKSVV